MSGILGIWNLDGRPVERSLLQRLSATLAHRGRDGGSLWLDGPAGLASQMFRVTPESLTEAQPLVSSSGTVVVFDGRLDNREELLPLLNARPGISVHSADSVFVLAAYEVFGPAFPEKLNGDFALAVFDPGRRQLILARDALGVRPLYYCRLGETFLFASETKAILAHPQMSPRPDVDMLAEFAVLGLFGDEPGSTFFEGVHSLRPAHLALVTPANFVVKQYWDFDVTRRVRLKSFEDYAESFRQLFFQAVQRRLRSAYPVAVSVSGGLDLSSVFCAAETLRRRNSQTYPSLRGLTYAFNDGSPMDEEAFVGDIEKAYDISIERVPWGPPGLLSGSQKEMRHIEVPLLNLMSNNTQSFLATIRQLDARVLMGGQWGDELLFDWSYLIDLSRRLRFRDIGQHLREYGRWYTDADPKEFKRLFCGELLRSSIPDRLVPLLKKLRSKVARDRSEGSWYTDDFRKRALASASRRARGRRPYATAHAKSMYLEARSRYKVLRMEIQNKAASMHGLEMNFPFLDRDLISFLISIPGEMQTRNGVPRAILREGLRGILPESIAARRWKADATHLANSGLAGDLPAIREYLGPDLKSAELGFVSESNVRKRMIELDNQLSGSTATVAWGISGLVGMELWLRTFFADAQIDKGRNLEYAIAG